MVSVNDFFNNLNRDIRDSRTKKALRLLEKRGWTFVRNLNDRKQKKSAMKKFKMSRKLIKKRSRMLN